MWFRRIFSTKPATAPARRAAVSKPDTLDLKLSPNALRLLNRLHLNTARALPGFGLGLRPSVRRRPAADFREHRMYAPGDDVRFVDWRASARQEHIFIKQGEYQKDATIFVLVDCSASMRWGYPPKAFPAFQLAAALSYVTLAHGDRLVLGPLLGPEGAGSAMPQPLGPVTGKGQFPTVLNYLNDLPLGGQVDLERSLREYARRGGARGGLALLLTDLLAIDNLGAGLKLMRAPTWNLAVLHLLHPAELKPPVRGEFEMQDIETGQKKNFEVSEKALAGYQERLTAWLDSLEQICAENKALYTLLPTNWSLESEMIPHLRGLNILRPV